MENYFANTPYFKIWSDLIILLTKKTASLLTNSSYAFSKIICQREDVRAIYFSGNNKLEIVFSHEERIFFCTLVNSVTGETIGWKGLAPEIVKFITMEQLEVEIDKWMIFLKKEIIHP